MADSDLFEESLSLLRGDIIVELFSFELHVLPVLFRIYRVECATVRITCAFHGNEPNWFEFKNILLSEIILFWFSLINYKIAGLY